MKASNIKGALFEYVIRKLLMKSGFVSVIPDDFFIFKKGNLTMINGRGAAHDADVLLEPPIQMPFTYPSRLNFECKAYNKTVGLPVIRNALGLRYDLNEFEITTREQLLARKNNRRISLAVDNRQRFYYQIGVASIEKFSKPAIEFAANNKIPLISLRWFLPNNVCDKFHEIDSDYIETIDSEILVTIFDFLKKDSEYTNIQHIIPGENLFSEIIGAVHEYENRVLIGLLESGDLLLLYSKQVDAKGRLLQAQKSLRTQFHYSSNQPDVWRLTIDINGDIGEEICEFEFRLPQNIVNIWKQQNYDRQAAIKLKEERFSRVFIFLDDPQNPFRILKIDQNWFESLDS